jgi:hypothetical protein
MSVEFPANVVCRRRQQSIWRVTVIVVDIPEAPLPKISQRSTVDLLANTSRLKADHWFAMETRDVGVRRFRLRRPMTFVLVSLDTLNNSLEALMYWVIAEQDVRMASGSNSDATNTTIPVVDAAARSSWGILNHVRAHSWYITRWYSMATALYTLSDVSQFKLCFSHLKRRKIRRWQIQQQHRQ